MTTKSLIFLAALIPVGLALTGKLKMSTGIGIGVALVVVANFIPDTSQAAA